MADRPRLLDDLAGVAGGAVSALVGLRDEAEAMMRARVDETLRRLDLVRREEFDAVAAMVAKARMSTAASLYCPRLPTKSTYLAGSPGGRAAPGWNSGPTPWWITEIGALI